MTDATNPVSSSENTGTANTAEQTGIQGSGKGYDENTVVTTMADLKEKAPDLYNSMLKSLMMNMVNQMNRFRRNIKRAMKQ